MGRNEIEVMGPRSMNHLNSLRYADFHRNKLSTFHDELSNSSSPFGHDYKNFQRLNLSYNEITKIYSDWTIMALYLKQLDLSHNNITVIDVSYLNFIIIYKKIVFGIEFEQ